MYHKEYVNSTVKLLIVNNLVLYVASHDVEINKYNTKIAGMHEINENRIRF